MINKPSIITWSSRNPITASLLVISVAIISLAAWNYRQTYRHIHFVGDDAIDHFNRFIIDGRVSSSLGFEDVECESSQSFLQFTAALRFRAMTDSQFAMILQNLRDAFPRIGLSEREIGVWAVDEKIRTTSHDMQSFVETTLRQEDSEFIQYGRRGSRLPQLLACRRNRQFLLIVAD